MAFFSPDKGSREYFVWASAKQTLPSLAVAGLGLEDAAKLACNYAEALVKEFESRYKKLLTHEQIIQEKKENHLPSSS